MRPQRFNNDLGPVASWLFDGDLTDSSGNGYHLSLEAGTERYCVSGWIPDDGVDGGLCIDTTVGNNRMGRATPDAALTLQGDVSLQALVLAPNWQSGSQTIIACNGSNGALQFNTCYRFVQTTGGSYVEWYTGSSPSTQVIPTSLDTNNPFEWTHIAFTRTDNGDGTSDVAFYKNGQRVSHYTGGDALTTGTGGSSSLINAFGASDGSRYFYGLCAGIQIYNFVLTPTQIYNQALRVVPLYATGGS